MPMRNDIGSYYNMKLRLLHLLLIGFSVFSVSQSNAQVPFEKDGKWGLLDNAGKVILKPKYSSIGSFVDGWALVKNTKGKYGIINKSGSEYLGCNYDDMIFPFIKYKEQYYLWVKKGGKWGLFCKDYITNYRYDEAVQTPAGVLVYLAEDYLPEDYHNSIDKGWYLTYGSRRSTEPLSEDYNMPRGKFSDNLWLIGNDIYDDSGKRLFSGVNDIIQLFPDNFVKLVNWMDGYVIDKHTGAEIDRSNYDIIGNFVCQKDSQFPNLVYYVDKDGKTQYAVYDNSSYSNEPKSIVPFSENQIYYKEEECYLGGSMGTTKIIELSSSGNLMTYADDIVDKFGGANIVIIKDKNGIFVYSKDSYYKPFIPIISGRFSDVHKISGGWVITDGNSQYVVDENGKRMGVGASEYDIIVPYKDYFYDNLAYVQKGELWGLINMGSGEVLIPVKYNRVYRDSGNVIGEFTVKDENGKIGFYSIKKKKFTAPIGSFDVVLHNYSLSNDLQLLVVEKDDKMGAFCDGKFIVPLKHKGYSGWNGEDKIFFDDDDKFRTGTTFYVYTLGGQLLIKQFFYNDQKREYRKWANRYMR